MLDRNVVIAGGAAGIGAALCSSCIRQGANVLVCDKLDADSLKFGFAPLEEADPGQLEYRECDLTRPGQVEALAGAAESLFGGKINVLINCVGINMRSPLLDLDVDDWDRSMETNFRGRLPADQGAGADDPAGRGQWFFLSGASSLRPRKDNAAFALTKMALNRPHHAARRRSRAARDSPERRMPRPRHVRPGNRRAHHRPHHPGAPHRRGGQEGDSRGHAAGASFRRHSAGGLGRRGGETS